MLSSVRLIRQQYSMNPNIFGWSKMAKKIIVNEEDDEDNIVIANMNVEGMPWYHKEETKKEPTNTLNPQEQASWKDTFFIMFGALKAALLIVLIFSAALVLFTLFCTNIWL
jgi:hypothetical protein